MEQDELGKVEEDETSQMTRDHIRKGLVWEKMFEYYPRVNMDKW